MKQVIFLAIMGIAQLGWASEAHSASNAPNQAVCKHVSGYGTYEGRADNKHEARSQASRTCASDLADQYERAHGRMPDIEQYEDMIVSCLNICP
jgi:hypothetical protein